MATLTLDFLRGYTLGERRESVPVAYQYDQGHSLEVNVPAQVTTCEMQYFVNGLSEAPCYNPTSITQEADGTYTILANVPNSLFEVGSNINVYIVVTDNSDSITKYEGLIPVRVRQIPDDYVDTDPDNSAVSINSTAQTLYEQMQTLVQNAIVCTDTDTDGNVVITLGGS